ncbi:MAG: hypothetical protein INQ03_04020 [Candidatus Heimdallarchaeota archaeon]|nr:hypothetical protein [Candidatus Heimdallarchaeota archaeon]
MAVSMTKIKILILGDDFDKKNNYLQIYLNEELEQDRSDQNPIFAVKTIILKGRKFALQFWQLSEEMRLKSVREVNYLGSQAMILLYDISNKRSFDNLPNWITECMENNEDMIIPMGLVGYYSPDREVSFDEGSKYAEELSKWGGYKVPYLEVNSEQFLRATHNLKTHQDFLTLIISQIEELEI